MGPADGFDPRGDIFPDEEALPLEPAMDEGLEGWRSRCGLQRQSYGPPAQMGAHLRIQAEAGYRAGVIQLRPGLFLVAELPAEMMNRPEFGAAFLVPLVTSVAVEALKNPETQKAISQATKQGVQAIAQLTAPKPAAHRAPPALPPARAPQPSALPAPAPAGQPQVAWASEEELAGIFGCEGYMPGHCPCAWRRS